MHLWTFISFNSIGCSFIYKPLGMRFWVFPAQCSAGSPHMGWSGFLALPPSLLDVAIPPSYILIYDVKCISNFGICLFACLSMLQLCHMHLLYI